MTLIKKKIIIKPSQPARGASCRQQVHIRMGSGLLSPHLPSGAFPVVPSPRPGPPRHLPVIMEVVTWPLAPAPPCKQVLTAVGGGCWGCRVLPSSLSMQPQTTLQAAACRHGCVGAMPFPRCCAPTPILSSSSIPFLSLFQHSHPTFTP